MLAYAVWLLRPERASLRGEMRRRLKGRYAVVGEDEERDWETGGEGEVDVRSGASAATSAVM